MSDRRVYLRWVAVGFFLTFLAVGSSGCGNSTNHVTGIVRFDGKPLRSGEVMFVDSDGKPHFAAIAGRKGEHQTARGDAVVGEYRIDLPEGDFVIAVIQDASVPPGFASTPRPDDKVHKRGSELRDQTVFIPEYYKDPSTSGLKYHVRKGPQSHDVDLKP